MPLPVRVYLDHAATTPLRPEALAAMRPFLRERFGNASSLHGEGRSAREALEAARESLLDALGAASFQLLFTSGGTEADTLAVVGTWLAARAASPGARARVLASAVEHSAVLGALSLVEELGGGATSLPVDRHGRLLLDALEAAMGPDVAILSLMAANNETGALQPLAEATAIVRGGGALVHSDAVQALGELPGWIAALPVDLWSLSAHKVGGPKGVGALLVRKTALEAARLRPLLRGGLQEAGLRAGTEAVALAVGFAAAARAHILERREASQRLANLRDRVRAAVEARHPRARVFTPREGALPTHLCVAFPHVEGESLVRLLDHHGVAVSTGSACQASAGKPSHVLSALGASPEEVRGSVRISLGHGTTAAEIVLLLEALERSLEQLGGLSPR